MDLEKIKRKYRRNVWGYDLLVRRSTERLRREAVAMLALRLGDRVLDLGCGTGLSFPLLRAAVGDGGIVYGVDVSPDMLDRARGKIAEAGWTNVLPVEGDAEHLPLKEPVDGVLCFYTHDIMLSPTALPRVIQSLRPEGRMVAAGAKLARGWRGWVINPLTVLYSLPAVTTLDHRRSYEPFSLMRSLLTDFTVEERLLGSQYLAWGLRQAPVENRARVPDVSQNQGGR
jgi:demethylmenaquinone methyltransferase/2-methoxy-6-polyprenyl-1,4-benzoquinol methylase